jgi:hypothetical protein
MWYLAGVLCYKNLGEVPQKLLAQQTDVLQQAAREAALREPSAEPSAVPTSRSQAAQPCLQGESECSRLLPPPRAVRPRKPPPGASLLPHANSGSGSCTGMNRFVGFQQRAGRSGPS